MLPEDRWRRGDVAYKEFDQDCVVLDPATGEFFHLESVSYFIWCSLDGSRTLKEIANRVAERFEVAEDQALRDLLEFANELKKRTLVVPA